MNARALAAIEEAVGFLLQHKAGRLALSKGICRHLLVKRDEEQYVLGVVLEPESLDTQGDVVSADEIRKAAHRFLELYGVRGLMHEKDIGERAVIVESFIAPEPLAFGGETVRKGAWLMGWIVVDRNLWAAVKRGEFTGFSIGGSALRVSERQ